MSRDAGRRLWTAPARWLGLRILLCGGPRCRRFAVAHPWLRQDGVLLAGADREQQAWLCSPECFEAALPAKLAVLPRGRGDAMPRLPRMPFRLGLLAAGALSEEGLAAASHYAQQANVALSTALLDLGFCTEEQLALALARENSCAFYTLEPARVSPGRRLPVQLSTRFRAVVVHGSTDRCVVGFTQRIDRNVLAMAAQMFGGRPEPCFITASHYARQRLLDGGFAETPLLMVAADVAAQKMRDRAVRLGAEQVRLARSADLLWVRYTGRQPSSEPVDELFLLEEGRATIALPQQTRGIVKKKRQVP